MNVHELYTALSQCDRAAKVTIEDGKLHVGGEPLKVSRGAKGKDEAKVAEVEGGAPEGGQS
jgi:hypothetical protein